jgi:hypothetical protein
MSELTWSSIHHLSTYCGLKSPIKQNVFTTSAVNGPTALENILEDVFIDNSTENTAFKPNSKFW